MTSILHPDCICIPTLSLNLPFTPTIIVGITGKIRERYSVGVIFRLPVVSDSLDRVIPTPTYPSSFRHFASPSHVNNPRTVFRRDA